MRLGGYIIDQAGKDWSEILSGWSFLLPETFTIWFMNRFGDLILVFEDEAVHLLDAGAGVLTRVASNRAEFSGVVDQNDNASVWFMIPLVDQCVAQGISLAGHQCYGFKLPPNLGGKYVIENVTPTDLSVYHAFAADIARQIKDIPNGTKVSIKILGL